MCPLSRFQSTVELNSLRLNVLCLFPEGCVVRVRFRQRAQDVRLGGEVLFDQLNQRIVLLE